MTFPKTISTLLAQNHGLHEAVGNLVKASFHRMIVGIIQYLTLTRPYFTHSVKLASQFKQNPNSAHLQGVKRILRYIKDTLYFGLRLFHNHHVGCMGTQMLIGEVVPPLGEQLWVTKSI